MAGISSKAAGKIENKLKYNGIGLEHQEFSDGSGLEEYSAFYRNLDPQTGRWWQVDPETEKMEMWSPYVSNYDNPILYKDPLGNEGEACCGFLDALKNAGDKIMLSASATLWGALNTATAGFIPTDPFNVRPGLSSEEKMFWDNGVTIGQIAPLMSPSHGSKSAPEAGLELAPAGGKGNIKTEPVSTEPPISNTKQSISNKQPGSYTNTHASNKTYSGKGPKPRAKVSADRIAKDNNDPLKASDWKPSENTRESFKDEDTRIQENGGAGSSQNYNKINSPGKKYKEQDSKKE
jgi:RHS repeat-associated protein